MSALAVESDLTAAQFREISRTVYEIAGIQLREGKEGLVRSRLAKRLRALNLPSFEAYLERVRADARELAEMVDQLTTNKTSFFRESAHFDFLRDRVLPTMGAGPVRIWSAGCSSGEEPYTLAMIIRDAWSDADRRDVKILATDISRRVLATAQAGVYPDALMEEVAPELLRRHWTRSAATPAGGRPDSGTGWRANDALRKLVTFAPLNLMGKWPMRGPFQAIFCRNVMIYFDKATQQALIERYYDLLAPGGHLFVGHSESLSALSHRFSYVQPAVYRK